MKTLNNIKNRFKSISSQKGSSLVEVLVGITIMGIVVVGFASILMASNTMHRRSSERVRVDNQLFSMIESSDPYLDIVNSATVERYSLNTKDLSNQVDTNKGIPMKIRVTEVVLGNDKSNNKEIKLTDTVSPEKPYLGVVDKNVSGWFQVDRCQVIHYNRKFVDGNGTQHDFASNFYKIGNIQEAVDEIS